MAASQNQKMAQAEHLRQMAAQWRAKASETGDEYYITLMTRTAEALEAEAADLVNTDGNK